MDLYAYTQIPRLSEEIKDIVECIPRLRGIRKMSEEELQGNEENKYRLERFNHYVGQEGVYMIHARIGGEGPSSNWEYFGGPEKVASQPWFLEKVDDWDTTYCDIYVTTNYEKEEEKRTDYDYADALDSITWYNGLAEYVDRWKDLPTTDHGTILCPSEYYVSPNDAPTPPWYTEVAEQLQVIWMIAVELFGDYGASPRYGWIDKPDEFRGWVYRITQTWRESLGDKKEVLNDSQTDE